MKSMPVVFTQAFSNISAQTDTCFNGDVIYCMQAAPALLKDVIIFALMVRRLQLGFGISKL